MPADHHLDNGLQRIVLSDWDASATPPRCEMLRLEAGASQPRRLKTCLR
jgi:UDP-2,3-diacylglucosamine hydrolase